MRSVEEAISEFYDAVVGNDLPINSEDQLRERLMSEHQQRTLRLGSIRRRTLVNPRIALLFALVTLSIGGVALAANAIPTDRIPGRAWFTHDAVDQADGVGSSQNESLSDMERRALRQMFDGAPVAVTTDHGPILEEMQPMGTGRVLYDGPGGRLAALPSKRGDICFVFSAAGRNMGGTCVPEFKESGVHFSISSRADYTFRLPGLFADDVTSIIVITRDGTRERVDLGDNGFVWQAREFTPAALPSQLVITRAGKTHRIELDELVGDPSDLGMPPAATDR